jgi:integrase
VFCTLTGKPHHQRNALRAVQNAALNAKLGHVTAHDLRHSLVANALDARLTLAEASRLARHASPAVTGSVYADVLEAKRESLGAKFAQTGFGA